LIPNEESRRKITQSLLDDRNGYSCLVLIEVFKRIPKIKSIHEATVDGKYDGGITITCG